MAADLLDALRPRHHGVGADELPVEGRLPRLDGAIRWLNSPPLSPESLRGRVVAVQFWTYTCINWLRTQAHYRAWSQAYREHGLVSIGVHTPEFAFEHDIDNVERAVARKRIDYPVAVDSDFRVWRAFANHYWPALYLVDAEGRIRHHRFGEGDYDRSEMVIRTLLTAAGSDQLPSMAVIDPTPEEVQADWAELMSGETYLGSEQATGFEASPSRLRLNQWSLEGDWTVRSDAAALNAAGGRVVFQFHARDVNLVMGPASPGQGIPFRVYLDGRLAGDVHGADVDSEGQGVLSDQRMYQLIRQSRPISDRRFEIEFLGAGAEAFCFTFG